MILLPAPIVLPFVFIILALLVKSSKAKSILSIAFSILNLAIAGIILFQVNEVDMIKSQMGSWPAPFGITLIADRFSAFMLFMSALVFIAVTIYSVQSIDKERIKNNYFLFTFGILMGVNGSFLAGDIFNLYVWFEVMLMGSFILISFGGERIQLEGAIKYLILNLISSFFFVAGIGILYGKMGSLNMADLAQKFAFTGSFPSLFEPAMVLFVVGFAIKGALFPFFFWLPASYHTPPPAVSALFAGLLTKVGIYSLIRIYTLFLFHFDYFWNPIILWLGILSMVIGVITATSQFDFRKVLSFHIISQVGYVVIGLAFYTISGLAAAIFFLGHNMISKTNAFMVAGWVHRERKTLNMKVLGEMFNKNTLWGVLFFISAFSLAGLPPLSGFAGKYLIIKAGIESDHIFVALIALFVGLFTLFSMTKIWIEVFWKNNPTENAAENNTKALPHGLMLTGSIILALSIIAMGIWAAPIVEFCEKAAADLLNTQKYINFVLK
ncbi:MAG: pH regulation protein D [Bacteroidetes bacterium GWF2_33_16]|nr:MAG: pH regulation protein D [Bacteroidetes bacterium GWE2_32_14]OFY06055.1 MAG: pH regulation protein D [Bacteroidetes bacterium GWF2_33_16]